MLADARALLDRGGPSSAQLACWLVRSALEETIADLLAAKNVVAGEASMRTRLSCLETAYADHEGLAARAEYAWSALSAACHHHAYQLTPTATEATAYIEAVASLRSRLATSPSV